MLPDYNYVSTTPRLQILNQDNETVLDFLVDSNLAQKIAWRMNISHWSVKEPTYAG